MELTQHQFTNAPCQPDVIYFEKKPLLKGLFFALSKWSKYPAHTRTYRPHLTLPTSHKTDNDRYAQYD